MITVYNFCAIILFSVCTYTFGVKDIFLSCGSNCCAVFVHICIFLMEVIPLSTYFQPACLCIAGFINEIFLSLIFCPSAASLSIFTENVQLSVSGNHHDIFIHSSCRLVKVIITSILFHPSQLCLAVFLEVIFFSIYRVPSILALAFLIYIIDSVIQIQDLVSLSLGINVIIEISILLFPSCECIRSYSRCRCWFLRRKLLTVTDDGSGICLTDLLQFRIGAEEINCVIRALLNCVL